MKEKYLKICPYGADVLGKIVSRMRKKICFWGTVAAGAVYILYMVYAGINVSLFLSIALVVYIVAEELPNFDVQRREELLYRELLQYLSRVKNRYMVCRHIPNAVYDGAENMSYEIGRYAGVIYHLLTDSERLMKVKEYVAEEHNNKYVKLFLVQAYEASEKGDTILENKSSLFAANIEFLRAEIMEELYRRKKRAYEFAGYIFVAVTPVFFLPVFKQWGLEFDPGLENFYRGTGKMVELVTILGTWIVYGLINHAKEISLYYGRSKNIDWFSGIRRWEPVKGLIRHMERHSGRFSTSIRRMLLQTKDSRTYGDFMTKILLLCSFATVFFFCFVCYVHSQERNIILSRVENIEMIAPLASEEKQKRLEKIILDTVDVWKEKKEFSEEMAKELVEDAIFLANGTTKELVAEEIVKRTEQYKAAHITWWEVLFCIGGSILLGNVPLWKLLFHMKHLKEGVEDEIRQFYAVIVMERELGGMTIPGLLEDMEIFSKAYTNVLRKCINSYSAGPKEALLRMKEEGGRLHSSFPELADAFLSVDDVGISEAFAEVESNRELLRKISGLEREMSMERKKDSTDMIAKIPTVLAVGAYFILPFFSSSLKGVFEIFMMLEEMKL